LLSIYEQRLSVSDNPLTVRWVPSHLQETTPIYQISDAEGRAAGSSWIDIRCNRQADRFAKQAICQDNQPNSFTRETVLKLPSGRNG